MRTKKNIVKFFSGMRVMANYGNNIEYYITGVDFEKN